MTPYPISVLIVFVIGFAVVIYMGSKPKQDRLLEWDFGDWTVALCILIAVAFAWPFVLIGVLIVFTMMGISAGVRKLRSL